MDIYSLTDTPISTDSFTSYQMEIDPQKGKVCKVSISYYSKKLGGYYNKVEKYPGEEGFEEMQQKIFLEMLLVSDSVDWRADEIRNLRKSYPQLILELLKESKVKR